MRAGDGRRGDEKGIRRVNKNIEFNEMELTVFSSCLSSILYTQNYIENYIADWADSGQCTNTPPKSWHPLQTSRDGCINDRFPLQQATHLGTTSAQGGSIRHADTASAGWSTATRMPQLDQNVQRCLAPLNHRILLGFPIGERIQVAEPLLGLLGKLGCQNLDKAKKRKS